MKNILLKVYKKIKIFHNIYLKNKAFLSKKSYSMEGEDLQILRLTKDIKNGFFVDAGCYHPIHLNNTYLLYKKNWRGINIDLSEFTIDLFNFLRPEDININTAIDENDGEVIFYHQKEISQLNTIKKQEAEKRMQGAIKEKKIYSKKLTSILNSTKYSNRKIDFLNVDLEGADLEALKSLDFKIYRPKIICVEIIDQNLVESEVYKFLNDLDYEKKWSSTFNHIFLDKFIKNFTS